MSWLFDLLDEEPELAHGARCLANPPPCAAATLVRRGPTPPDRRGDVP